MTTDIKSFKELLLEWFNEERNKNDVIKEAAEATLRRIVQSGFADQALLTLGSEILIYFWRKEQRDERLRSIEPGRRRFETKYLNNDENLMNALVFVEGISWIPLGDLTKRECKIIAEAYRKREIGNKKWRIFYERLEQNLEHGESHVRDMFTSDQLRSIFREQGLDESELE